MQRQHLSFGVMVVALLGLSVYAGIAICNRNARPVLEIENLADLELGQVALQEPFSRTIRVVNTGRRIAEVGDVRASCACASVSPATFELNPGEVRDVELIFDLQSVTNRDDIPSHHDFAVTLLATTKPPHRHAFQWRFKGRVSSVFKRVPKVVEVQGGTPRSLPICGEFTVECHESLDELRVAAIDSPLVTRVEADEQRRVFRVGLRAALPEYEKKVENLQIVAIHSGTRLSPIITDVVLRRVPDVRAEPAFLNLGVVYPNDQRTAIALRLVSTTHARFQTGRFMVLATSPTKLTLPSQNAIEVTPDENVGEFAIRAVAMEPGTHAGYVAFEIQQADDVYVVEVPYIYYASDVGNYSTH